jgi:hypothetical protein
MAVHLKSSVRLVIIALCAALGPVVSSGIAAVDAHAAVSTAAFFDSSVHGADPTLQPGVTMSGTNTDLTVGISELALSLHFRPAAGHVLAPGTYDGKHWCRRTSWSRSTTRLGSPT